MRKSNNNKFETVYVVLKANSPLVSTGKKEVLTYITKTGKGYGGNGNFLVRNVMKLQDGLIMTTLDIMAINEKQKLPVWWEV